MKPRACVLFSLDLADLDPDDAGDGGADQIRADVYRERSALDPRDLPNLDRGRRSTSPEHANLGQIVDAQRTATWTVVIPFGSLRIALAHLAIAFFDELAVAQNFTDDLLRVADDFIAGLRHPLSFGFE
jgi:hypothetical protein